MKISIIGVGVQGSAIALISTKVKEISEVLCSDINFNRAKRVVEKLKTNKLRAERVDAGNLNDLLRVVRGTDVVINATMPKFNLNVMNAALKGGANYVDLAAGDPPKQLKLSNEWKNAGLTAVISQGGPFVMNVLVRYAADRLDRVSEIRLRFGWKSLKQAKEIIPTWSPAWCPEIALTEWLTEPTIYKNGKFKNEPTFSGIEEYTFPNPVGPLTLCLVDYEPVHTLPLFIGKGVRYVDCKIPPDIMAGALIKLGLASDKTVKVKGVKVAPRDVLLALVPPPGEVDRKPDWLACYLAEIKGEKSGVELVHTLYRISNAQENLRRWGTAWADVAIPVVITATMLANEEIKAKGVIPPERLDPDPFLLRMADWGITFRERIMKEIHPVT